MTLLIDFMYTYVLHMYVYTKCPYYVMYTAYTIILL